MAETKRVWVTPRLSGESCDEIWHETLDDALDYIGNHLAQHIGDEFTEDELVEFGGYRFTLEPRLVGPDEWDAVFVHDEVTSEGDYPRPATEGKADG